MLNSISKAIISSAIIITPFLATSQVHADDENVYDASECVTVSGTPTLSSSGALVNNSSTTTLNVRCPLQRDRNHGVLDPIDSFVLIRDHNNSRRVTCSIRQNILGRLNTITLETSTVNTDNAFSSTEYLRYSFPRRNFANRDEGSFYMYCSLPPRQSGNLGSSVSSFHIDED